VDVVATSSLSYVELKGEDALAWCEESPDFEIELRRFCNNRMIQNLIRTSELFSHFDIATGSLLAQSFVQKTFVGGDLLVSCGEPGKGLWLIANGQVGVQIPAADDTMSKMATLGEGEIFGEISLMTSLPTTAQLVAESAGWALFLDKCSFQELLDEHPEVADYVNELGRQRVAQQKEMAQ
jgi:CRP-like cAMP-binding protein